MISAGAALAQLQNKYAFSPDRADRILEIARRVGPNSEPVPGGIITVTFNGGTNDGFYYTIEENTSASSRKVVAEAREDYTQTRTLKPPVKGRTMARGRTAAPVAAETEEARDYTVYKDKEPTATMVDFADWIVEEVGVEFGTAKEMAAFRDGVRLGGTLRMEFQRSDLNKTRREERRAARVTGNGANEPAPASEPAPAEPEAAAEPARPARRGRPPKPASKRRGRPAPAEAAVDAPY